MSAKYKKAYRVFVVLAIISFLLFQGVIIRSNIRYGNRSEISEDNLDLIVSSKQPRFEITSISPPQTMQNGKYFAIGHTRPYVDDGHFDLLTITFDQTYSTIHNVDVIEAPPVLLDQLGYRGLYYFDDDLWTIGATEEFVDSNYSKVHSTIIRFNTTGHQITRYPLPIEEVTLADEIGYGSSHKRIVKVNQTTVSYVFTPTYNESYLIHYDLQERSTHEEELFMSYHDGSSMYFDSGLLWLKYNADPYDLKDEYEDGDEDKYITGRNSYHAVRFESPSESFTKSIIEGNLLSQNNQVPSTSLNTEFENPLFIQTKTLGFVEGNFVFYPTHVQDGANASNWIFYGFERYSPKSSFFSTSTTIFLSTTTLFTIMALVARLTGESNETDTADLYKQIQHED